jgi:hypothetical protein
LSDDLDKDYWEEIFDSIDMDFLPIEYIKCIIVQFDDGKIWEIDTGKKNLTFEEIEETLKTFFKEFDDVIESVDFRLDLEKIKNDVSRRTRRFLKLNK